MGKIIQFSNVREEKNTDTEKEIWEVVEESYRAKNEKIRKKDEELNKLYEEFYSNEEDVEAFYNTPY
ncbi:hypothetical protein HAHI6034_05110 [Hathewaya histolytica]|uniref:Uncharacterized protein n=1 Tax=Hathewaya histolytica TaxID=1498 RepID=A0A4V6KD35_HATHI|nr:hypothetical protein [Hathewaya histolytica]VTQ86837.1 Uncharacterised protein [Hathewaya histolytica]